MPSALSVDGYVLHDVLGTGTAGTVYRASLSVGAASSSAASFAVKVIPCAKVRTAVRREVALHAVLHHPNIAVLHRVLPVRISTPFPLSHSPHALALVTELAPAGDMFAEVAAAGCLKPRLLRRRLRDIVAALTYLHNNDILHLDLKLENVVLSRSQTAKLIDFGCARTLASNHKDSPLGGTLHYLPPELVADPNRSPGKESDAWSLGVLVYTALAGSYPFNGAVAGATDQQNDTATRQRILHSRPHTMSACIQVPSDLRRIVFGLLEKDPQKRMTIDQVVQELSRSIDTSSIATSTGSLLKPGKSRDPHRNCASSRPRSPASPAEADFAPCNCGAQQSQEEALRVVDAIQRSRARTAAEVRWHMSDINPASGRSRQQRRASATASSKMNSVPKRSSSGGWMV